MWHSAELKLSIVTFIIKGLYVTLSITTLSLKGLYEIINRTDT